MRRASARRCFSASAGCSSAYRRCGRSCTCRCATNPFRPSSSRRKKRKPRSERGLLVRTEGLLRSLQLSPQAASEGERATEQCRCQQGESARLRNRDLVVEAREARTQMVDDRFLRQRERAIRRQHTRAGGREGATASKGFTELHRSSGGIEGGVARVVVGRILD